MCFVFFVFGFVGIVIPLVAAKIRAELELRTIVSPFQQDDLVNASARSGQLIAQKPASFFAAARVHLLPAGRETPMPYCSHCGQAMQDAARFCAACGSVVSSTQPHATSNASGAAAAPAPVNRVKPQPTNATAIAWAMVVFLLFLCLVALVGIFGHDSSTSSWAGNPIDPKAILLRDVKLDFDWRTDGFGSIMVADFTVKNPTAYRFKDFEIKCTHSAPSGTVIDSNTRTVYEVVEPKSTKVVTHMNMGFIDSQAESSKCRITDLTVVR